jgi:hypothetical protein
MYADSLATLATSQQKVADAKLQQIMHDNQSKMVANAEVAEQADLDLRMKKFQMLMDICNKNPPFTFFHVGQFCKHSQIINKF